MDIISMAQQARPKLSGQMELLRDQFTALSSVVKMMPSSSSNLPKSSGLVSVTCLPSDVLILASTLFWHSVRLETNHHWALGAAQRCQILQNAQTSKVRNYRRRSVSCR